MKKFKVKFIKENAAVQNITVASDVDTQEENLDDVVQKTELASATTPTLQAQDVDGLDDKDVMNYVYFNVPQDIDDSTRQALFNRADQIRQKQMNGSTTPKDQEEFAKGVIAAAAQSKQKATMGEAYSSGRVDSFDEPSWADASFDDEEDSTYRHSYIPSQTSEEFMKSDEGKKARMLMPLKDAISDRIEEITDGEIDYIEIYDFVDDYINRAHEKYNLDEMKKYSKIGKGKVDFFAKVILMKYRKQK